MLLLELDPGTWVDPRQIIAITPSDSRQGGITTLHLRSGIEVYTDLSPTDVLDIVEAHQPFPKEQ